MNVQNYSNLNIYCLAFLKNIRFFALSSILAVQNRCTHFVTSIQGILPNDVSTGWAAEKSYKPALNQKKHFLNKEEQIQLNLDFNG